MSKYLAEVQARLTCDACHRTEGSYSSYEEWSDRAAALGWVVGEDVVICTDCLVRAADPLAEPAAPPVASPEESERSSAP
jgi:hypothetical protein